MEHHEAVDSLSSPIVAVVFDLDGTLVDSSDVKLGAYFAAMHLHAGGSHHEQAAAYALYGTLNRVEQLDRAFTRVVGRNPTDRELTALVDSYGAYCRERRDIIKLFEGFDELCERISAYRLAVASNAPQVEVIGLCAQLGIVARFERIYGFPVSKVDALRELAREWRLDCRQILYVGDRPEDAFAANAAGTSFRLIDHTGRSPYGHDRLVGSFRELAGFLTQHSVERWRD